MLVVVPPCLQVRSKPAPAACHPQAELRTSAFTSMTSACTGFRSWNVPEKNTAQLCSAMAEESASVFQLDMSSQLPHRLGPGDTARMAHTQQGSSPLWGDAAPRDALLHLQGQYATLLLNPALDRLVPVKPQDCSRWPTIIQDNRAPKLPRSPKVLEP